MKTWLQSEPDQGPVRELTDGLDISDIQARVLVNRGIRTIESARDFLSPSLASLHDPFMFDDMEKAVEILAEAIRTRKRILVHGDYDADGICGAALLFRYLSGAGADVHYFVPDRAKDGYGLSMRMMKRCVEKSIHLVISVDCGSSDGEIVSFLSENGIRTIITDHHEIDARIPAADAFINPKLPGESYPYKELAGVGVAFKLLQGLSARVESGQVLEDLLDLVAVGTLGDYSLLTGENRVLVMLGMNRLQQWDNPGLSALQAKSRLARAGFSAKQICFTIVPRLNSPGRMGRAGEVVELLVTDDGKRAEEIAGKIEEVNSMRRDLDREVTDKACQGAEKEIEKINPDALVLSSNDWHEGVVGIGAARLAEKFNLPSVLISVKGDQGKGSVRSARSVNIKEALTKCSEYLTVFGGHREAGGFTIPTKNIFDFKRCFNRAVKDSVDESGPEAGLMFDAEVDLAACSESLVSELEKIGPFGPGNEEPVLMLSGLKVLPETKVVGSGHLRFSVEDGSGEKRQLIGFSLARAWNPADITGRRMDVLISLGMNHYQGRSEVQFLVRAARYSEMTEKSI